MPGAVRPAGRLQQFVGVPMRRVQLMAACVAALISIAPSMAQSTGAPSAAPLPPSVDVPVGQTQAAVPTDAPATPQLTRADVDAWLDAPEADAKLVRFFATAFQQDGFEGGALTSQWADSPNLSGIVPGTRTYAFDALVRNVKESFARTALHHVRAGRPFDEVLTTDTFMMTTAMMVMLAYQDEASVDDAGVRRFRTLRETIPTVSYTSAPVPTLSSAA